MVAREWLDKGEYGKAYELCADASHGLEPGCGRRDFHAGWIALRFLDDPSARGTPFRWRDRGGADAAIDRTRLLLARPRGRGDGRRRRRDTCSSPTRRPIRSPITASLPRVGSGRSEPAAPRRPVNVAQGEQRWLATRVVELYFQAGFDDSRSGSPMRPPAPGATKRRSPRSATVVAAHASPSVAVTFGKLATERGYALDRVAFPLNGAPGLRAASRAPPMPPACSAWLGRRANSSGARRRAPAPRAHAGPAVDRAIGGAARRRRLRLWPARRRPRLQSAARRRLSRPNDRRRGRLAWKWRSPPTTPAPAASRNGSRVWRSAHRRDRSRGLGRAHPVRRDPRLRRARQREHRRLSRPAGPERLSSGAKLAAQQ